MNLVDIFNDQEEDDGYFNREELSKAFRKCNFETIGNEHEQRLEAVFMNFDPMRTLKIDYTDFLTKFYREANVSEAKIGNDMQSRIYDTVRKYLEKN